MRKIRVYCIKCGWIGKDTFTSICPRCASQTKKASDYLLCEKHIDCDNFEIAKMGIELTSLESNPFFILYCKKQDSGCNRESLYKCRSLIHLQKEEERKIEERESL